MWIPPEERNPVVFHHPTRESIGYFGAVRIRDGKFVFKLERESFNGMTFYSFLKYLRMITAGCRRKVILILDNVKYHYALLHKSWREACEERFQLEFLPPYSPELNVIERVWWLTRRHNTHNKYFSSLIDLEIDIETQFFEWRNGSQELMSLCAIS